MTLVALCAALACVSCGDEAASPESGAESDAGDDGHDADLPDDEPPAFLIGTRVWNDTTTTSYFHVVPSIERGTEVDLSRAIEVPGAAKLYAVKGVGWFAIGAGEEPTITRYTLGADGGLQAGEAISLQGYGVDSLWNTLYVVSPTKMYYPDRDGQRLIIINPTSMEIEGEVELPETGRAGYLSLYSYAHLTRGHQLLFSVAWIDWNESDSIVAETGLVVLDTDTHTVSRFDVDARCGGITQPIELASGAAYFVSSALAGAVHRLGRLSTEPCALRILAHEDRFDADYLLELGELGQGAIVGEPVPGGDDSVLLRVFDEGLASVAAGALSWELTGQAAWRWLRWNVETDDVTQIDELEPSTSDVLWFEVDGRVYGTQTTEDYSETTLYELNAPGGPKRALTAPGFLHGAARIR
jgi:hypothetical protein